MDVVDVSVGDDFACGRKKDGTVVCWGNQLTGELGFGHAPYPRMSCPGAFCQPAPVPACL